MMRPPASICSTWSRALSCASSLTPPQVTESPSTVRLGHGLRRIIVANVRGQHGDTERRATACCRPHWIAPSRCVKQIGRHSLVVGVIGHHRQTAWWRTRSSATSPSIGDVHRAPEPSQAGLVRPSSDCEFTRRLVGVGVHRGPVTGADLWPHVQRRHSGQGTPRHLSTDHDPLFEAHRWTANLRILEIDAIKTVPQVPLASGLRQRGTQARVVEGPHAVDLRRRTHGWPVRLEFPILSLNPGSRQRCVASGLLQRGTQPRVV